MDASHAYGDEEAGCNDCPYQNKNGLGLGDRRSSTTSHVVNRVLLFAFRNVVPRYLTSLDFMTARDVARVDVIIRPCFPLLFPVVCSPLARRIFRTRLKFG